MAAEDIRGPRAEVLSQRALARISAVLLPNFDYLSSSFETAGDFVDGAINTGELGADVTSMTKSARSFAEGDEGKVERNGLPIDLRVVRTGRARLDQLVGAQASAVLWGLFGVERTKGSRQAYIRGIARHGFEDLVVRIFPGGHVYLDHEHLVGRSSRNIVRQSLGVK